MKKRTFLIHISMEEEDTTKDVVQDLINFAREQDIHVTFERVHNPMEVPHDLYTESPIFLYRSAGAYRG